MFKHIFKNFYTTLAGCFAGAPTLIEGVQTGNPKAIITGLAVLLLGLTAKDGHNHN
jgi:hypothetical protein